MESITEAFPLIGFCTCVYAVARLLHYGSLKLRDDPDGSVLCPILSFICVGLWILSLPVSVVLGFIDKLHTDRLCRIAREDGKQIGRRLAELDPKSPPTGRTGRTPFD